MCNFNLFRVILYMYLKYNECFHNDINMLLIHAVFEMFKSAIGKFTKSALQTTCFVFKELTALSHLKVSIFNSIFLLLITKK